MNIVKTSYRPEDVTMLLTDLTGKIEPKSTKERELLIQSGVHYSEMLPKEYIPSKEYSELYNLALENFSDKTAKAVEVVSEKILEEKGTNVVLVSLARAGTPVGILIKHYIKQKYNVDIAHYTISIIRGIGIDDVAMQYILRKHKAEQLQFIDGWTGKGAILGQLKKAIEEYPGVSKELAVLADPANICRLCGTHDDFIIPSSCLNSTVSGLISRTILRSDLIDTEKEFHGAVYQKDMESSDVSYDFINKIEAHFNLERSNSQENTTLTGLTGMEEVEQIQKAFEIDDINLIKPGIGETTRVLLRRVPWKVLVKDRTDSINIGHILELAAEKGVEVLEYPLTNYNCIGLIKDMHADA